MKWLKIILPIEPAPNLSPDSGQAGSCSSRLSPAALLSFLELTKPCLPRVWGPIRFLQFQALGLENSSSTPE